MTGRAPCSLAERFWEKVVRTDDCWVWTGATTPESGYGIISVEGRTTKAHRVSYEMNVGPIPEGMFVCHHCDNPPCVRPDHLFVGTQADNLADGRAKGRIEGIRPNRDRCSAGCSCHKHEPRTRYWRGGRTCAPGCSCGRHRRASR